MKIDVIIPVCNPGAEFEALLERLGRQTLPVHKLLVMNTRSKTDVEKMLEGRPGIQTVSLEKEEFDHGGTRDRAARLSDADYLLFLTQDALPADEYLVERLFSPFSDKRVKAAYARQLPSRTAGSWSVIRGPSTIRRKAGLRQRRICRSLESRPFFVPMCARCMRGRPIWRRAALRREPFSMKT